MRSRHFPLLLAVIFAALFIVTGAMPGKSENKPVTPDISAQVVIAAPVQVLLFGGDRYLAADFEAIRAAALGIEGTHVRTNYRLRSHNAVSELNPCHEDNYYQGNAILTWGGMEKQGNLLLKRATECRFWDELPPFFYGFNQYFFYRNIKEAQKYLEIAAKRSSKNSASLRKLVIMIAVEQIDDTQMAVNFLREQTEKTTDHKLRQLLEKRLQRLQGLLALRQAQKKYEARYGKPLKNPGMLLNSGILEQFPQDPLGLGYEFKEGVFRLRSMKIAGMENHQ